MHGVPRSRPPLTPEQTAERAAKLQKYVRAAQAVLHKHQQQDVSPDSYRLTSTLMEINPDFYTLFNYRKIILQHMIKQDPSNAPTLCATELGITTKSLMKNPKSYVAWTHRRWVINLGMSDMQREMELCQQMLQLDSRNFHCWNYHRFIVEHPETQKLVSPPTLVSELQLTSKKIAEDFSNYSAWHHRAVILDRIRVYQQQQQQQQQQTLNQQMEQLHVHDSKQIENLPSYQTLIDNDFTLVKQAVWTDPEDQSAWLYHRWLLARSIATGPELPTLAASLGTYQHIPLPSDSSDRTSCHLILTRELSMCRELHAMEPHCKWVLLTMGILIAGLYAIHHDHAYITEIHDIFKQLIGLDGSRHEYYEYIHQQLMNTSAS